MSLANWTDEQLLSEFKKLHYETSSHILYDIAEELAVRYTKILHELEEKKDELVRIQERLDMANNPFHENNRGR